MSDDCVTVAIGGLTADGLTPDGDGIVWTVERLDGWWDSAAIRVAIDEVQPVGQEITFVRENGRPLSLQLIAHAADGQTALGSLLCFTALATADTAFKCVYEPVTMEVIDPVLDLHADVLRVGDIKHQILGAVAAVRFQIPLLAPDPYRYDGSDNPFD